MKGFNILFNKITIINYKILFIFILSLISSLATSAEIPLEHFTKHGDYLDITISPDGKHFAARIRHDGKVPLVFIERTSGKIVGVINPGINNEVHTVNWVDNDHVIYELAEKKYFLDKPISTGELFSANYRGKELKILFGYRAGDEKIGSRISKKKDIKSSQELVNILPDDPDNILIIEHPWSEKGNYYYDNRNRSPILSLLNLKNGKRNKIESIPFKGADVISTKAGDVLFASWTDENYIFRAAYRKTIESPWVELDENIFNGSGVEPVTLSDDASKVYFMVSEGELGIKNMLELDLVTGNKKVLFDSVGSGIYGWEVELGSGIPVVGISYKNKQEFHYSSRASETSNLHKMLAKAFDGQSIRMVDSTSDGHLVLLRVSSDINPGEYYLFDVETKAAEFIWANRSWIDPRHLRPTKPISIEARDGLKISGYLTLPERVAEKKSPMVVMIHGGPHGVRDYWSYDSEVQLLANRGYAVLQVNFRGSGGYGSHFQKLGYKEWGGKMIDDIIDATNWASNEESIDKNNICAYGASYGGYAAMMVAAKAPELYKCTIGYVGVYDLSLIFSEGDIIKSWGGLAYLNRAVGNEKDLLSEDSPVNRVDDIKANVMLIHGDNDRRVPVVHYDKMLEALKKANKPAKEMLFDLSGHGVWDEKSRNKLYSGMLEFLEENIGQK
ncbi:S9 family peptidase [uncultured Psychrosphaera sp.]|uniref:alpha/beta hydrolase family protein n=1 Tax=uncultured Psychrosphaera sp. TaxID=1403522 RepID=UPI0026025064|nr:S9 family peptidase [uncultured Psychrosphaera sp.]